MLNDFLKWTEELTQALEGDPEQITKIKNANNCIEKINKLIEPSVEPTYPDMIRASFKFDKCIHPKNVLSNYLKKNLHANRPLRKFILMLDFLEAELQYIAPELNRDEAIKVNEKLGILFKEFASMLDEKDPRFANKNFEENHPFIIAIGKTDQTKCLGPYMVKLWLEVINNYEYHRKHDIVKFFEFFLGIVLYIPNAILYSVKKIYSLFVKAGKTNTKLSRQSDFVKNIKLYLDEAKTIKGISGTAAELDYSKFLLQAAKEDEARASDIFLEFQGLVKREKIIFNGNIKELIKTIDKFIAVKHIAEISPFTTEMKKQAEIERILREKCIQALLVCKKSSIKLKRLEEYLEALETSIKNICYINTDWAKQNVAAASNLLHQDNNYLIDDNMTVSFSFPFPIIQASAPALVVPLEFHQPPPIYFSHSRSSSLSPSPSTFFNNSIVMSSAPLEPAAELGPFNVELANTAKPD